MLGYSNLVCTAEITQRGLLLVIGPVLLEMDVLPVEHIRKCLAEHIVVHFHDIRKRTI